LANTILTPTAVTREALRILHQKLNFIGTVYRDYDKNFAKEGAKIGDSLKIRLPNRYLVTNGPTLVAQDTSETSTTLQISSQKHVGMNFTSADLTLSLDDFSERIVDPAMAVLAASMEADAMCMYKDVNNQVNNLGSACTFQKVMQGRKLLTDSLAPIDKNRFCNLNTQDNVDIVNDVKSLFQDAATIASQYKEGMTGRTAGFDFFENTLWPRHTSGSDSGTGYHMDGANQTGSTLTIKTGIGTFKKGDIITIAGVNRVHPETKVDTGNLHQFVVTADAGPNATSLSIAPPIVISTSDPTQNCAAAAADNAQITKQGTASQSYGISMAYHKDAFAFATADLVMPQGVDFAARRVQDGISLRIVRQYDINNDKYPCRVDVLYGFKTIRAPLACRLANN
jgi:hypothetical protein